MVDGAGHKLEGAGGTVSKGMLLSGRSNVTIKNMEIRKFGTGIDLVDSSSNINISDNNMTNNLYGVWSVWSLNVSVSRNDIANNSNGVFLYYSFNNDISRNNIMANSDLGIFLYSSHNNTVSHNNFTMCGLVVWNPYENAVESNLVNGKPLV